MFCYVPGCPNANSGSTEPKKARMVHVFFSAPEDESLFEQWQAAVPKSDHLFSRKDKLCDFHFKKSEVVLFTETKLPNGNVRRIPASEPKLKAGTVPSIFPMSKSFSGPLEPKPASVPQKVSTVEGPKSRRKRKVSSSDESEVQEVTPPRPRGRPRKFNVKPSAKDSKSTSISSEKDENVSDPNSMTAIEIEIIKDVDSDVDSNEGLPQPKKPSIRVRPLESLMADNEAAKKRKLAEPAKKIVEEKRRRPGPKSRTRPAEPESPKRDLNKISEELEMAVDDFSDGHYEIEHVTDVVHTEDPIDDTFEAISIKSDPDDTEHKKTLEELAAELADSDDGTGLDYFQTTDHTREPRITGVISLCDMDDDGNLIRQANADGDNEIENEIAKMLGEDNGLLCAKGKEARTTKSSDTPETDEAANSIQKDKYLPEEAGLNIETPQSVKLPEPEKLTLNEEKHEDDKSKESTVRAEGVEDEYSKATNSEEVVPKPYGAEKSKQVEEEKDEGTVVRSTEKDDQPVKPSEGQVSIEDDKSIEHDLKSDNDVPSKKISGNSSLEGTEKNISEPSGQGDEGASAPGGIIEESVKKMGAVSSYDESLEPNDQVRISIEDDGDNPVEEPSQEPKGIIVGAEAATVEKTKNTGDALSDDDIVIPSSPEHLSISSDSERDPTWAPNAEAVEEAISDDNDTDPGNVDDEEKVRSDTDTSESKGKMSSAAEKSKQAPTDVAKYLTQETLQQILKTLKLPLDSPVTFTIADGAQAVGPPVTPKKKEKSVTPKAVIKTPAKNERTARSNKKPIQIAPEKGKKCEKLIGIKMFEGLGKIKKSFVFSTFLNDIEDELQFRKFCLIVKECLREVRDSKNAVTNVGKLTINMTHKTVKSMTMPVPELQPLTEVKTSAVTSKIKNDNEQENIDELEMNDMLECSTVDSNVENHIAIPIKGEE